MKELHSTDPGQRHDAEWRSRLSGARVLVTGGLGFIGSRLATRLVEYGATVTILDNLAPNTGANRFNAAHLADRANIRIGDIRDGAVMLELLERHDIVMNLAALIAHMDAMRAPADDLDVNARAVLSMLELARARRSPVRIVQAGTRQVYGRAEHLPITESHAARPIDVNGVNKLAADHYCALYHQVHGVRTTVLRLTNTYGPGMRICDGRQTFIGIWLRAAIEGTSFDVWGGDQIRDLVFVEDAVDAFCAAAVSESAVGETFNVGGSEALSLRALADRLITARGGGNYSVIPYPADRVAIEIGDSATDSSKIGRVLGWTPRTPLDQGLRETLAYYEQHLSEYV